MDLYGPLTNREKKTPPSFSLPSQHKCLKIEKKKRRKALIFARGRLSCGRVPMSHKGGPRAQEPHFFVNGQVVTESSHTVWDRRN